MSTRDESAAPGIAAASEAMTARLFQLYLQPELIVGAVAPRVADVVAETDALRWAVILAKITNLAIARIDDHGLGGRGVHADDIDGTGEHAQAAAGAGIEVDRELAVDGFAHPCTSAACSPRMMAPIGPSAAAS